MPNSETIGCFPAVKSAITDPSINYSPPTRPRFSVRQIPEDNYFRPSATEPMLWGTAIGAWGDVIAACGNIVKNLGRAGVLYYGKDPAIVGFLKRQAFCAGVRYVEPASQDEYVDVVRMLCSTQEWSQHRPDFAGLRERAHLDHADIYATHVEHAALARRDVNLWHGAQLCPEAWEWAAWTMNNIRMGSAPCAEFVVLQPYSTQSCPLKQHWPHWQEAIEFLLAFTPYTYILIGQNWEKEGTHPRIVNLIDAAPSMEHVFALTSMVGRCITTCNALSLYAVVNGVQSVVMGNGHLEPHNYFWRFINNRPVRLLEHGADIGAFVKAVAEEFLS